jgi:hypothetical protein
MLTVHFDGDRRPTSSSSPPSPSRPSSRSEAASSWRTSSTATPSLWYDGLFSIWDMRNSGAPGTRQHGRLRRVVGIHGGERRSGARDRTLSRLGERTGPGSGPDRGARVPHRALRLGRPAAHRPGRPLSLRDLRRAQLAGGAGHPPAGADREPAAGPHEDLAGIRLPARLHAVLPHVPDRGSLPGARGFRDAEPATWS